MESGFNWLLTGVSSPAAEARHSERASTAGATVALITTNPQSPIGALADVVLQVPAPTPKVEASERSAGLVASIQPMGSLFEQTLSLTLDSLVLGMMERTGQGA